MGVNDADLVHHWLHGDAAAFAALVGRWQGRIGRFLARLTGREELAPDLCQEVFLRLYRAGPRYRENGTFSTWLYQIALNVARDAVRRRRETPSLNGCEPEDPRPSAEAACAAREIARLVADAVAELPEPLRLVLVLRHYEGLSFEEIARLTGTPASTLKSRFAAALQRLRERLPQLDPGSEEKTA